MVPERITAKSMGSKSHVILRAVRHASDADILALRQLSANRSDILKLELTLRILLTYLPTGTEPRLYTSFVREISEPRPEVPCQASHLASPSLGETLSDEQAKIRARRLRLAPLSTRGIPNYQEADLLTCFLLHQAHRIDADLGSLELITQLLEPFIDHSEILRSWMITNLLPLQRLSYKYYPHTAPSYTLDEFGKLDAGVAVQSLLSRAVQLDDPGDTQKLGRDLRGLIGPWMYGERTRKRRKLDSRTKHRSSVSAATEDQEVLTESPQASEWAYVNHWLVDLSTRDFQRTVDAAVQWNGPSDVDYGDWDSGRPPLDNEELQTLTCRYAQAVLASIYATDQSSLETLMGSHRSLLQVARLLCLDEPPDLKRTDKPIVSGLDRQYITNLSSNHLHHKALLMQNNPFTTPSAQSITLLNVILTSCYKLLRLGSVKSIRAVAELSLFGNGANQLGEFRKTLHQLKAEKMEDGVWASIRRQMLWLQRWETQNDSEEPRGVFSKVAKPEYEKDLLRAMLDGGCYSFAVKMYCQSDELPLPNEVVESAVLSAALFAYDSASNGNRNRGGVRKMSDILSTFQHLFPNSFSFAQAKALLSATHAMSFYSLTLQHGVPFQPVNIRAHKDPVSLIGKILSQNPESYTHLDDLLDIGQNLVLASLTQIGQERNDADADQESAIARRRITRMAIEAALEENDFDTAYSYVVNRLSIGNQTKSNTIAKSSPMYTKQDDISWRAVYQAGCYPVSSHTSSRLRGLEQRMELLSQALLLAPSTALADVLAAWQKCEQEMTSQMAREAAEEKKWDEKADRKVPGEFADDLKPVMKQARVPTKSAPVEEAPMGLFEVARGAATALGKSAFPLRNVPKADQRPSTKSSQGRPLSTASVDSSDEGSMSGAGGIGRVRKRDMVSSMVTGGLASGIGWVIGESSRFLET